MMIPKYCVPSSEFVSEPEPYRIGTLRYTKLGLLLVFFILYTGVFALGAMRQLTPALLPIFLKQMNLSNMAIGVLLGTVPCCINVIANPWISFRSDRLRTRFGRRMPFMLIGVPGLSVTLITLGCFIQFGPELAQKLARAIPPEIFTIVVIGFLMVSFQAFTNMGVSVFYYFCTDVIPGKVIGRFMAIFMIFNSAGGFFFATILMPLAEQHMPLVFIAEGVMFLAAFTLVFLTVREGKYPPPPPKTDHSLFAGIKTFFRESFGIPFYVLIFLGFAINDVSTICRGMFNSLYATQQLGMSADQFGKVISYGMLVNVLLGLPLGMVIDRLKPFRIYMFGALLIIITNIWAFFFVKDTKTFTICAVIMAIVYDFQLVSAIPSWVMFFPKERYGQFSAACAIFSTGLIALFSYAAGTFIDIVGDYRYMFVWDTFFTSAGFVFLVIIYRKWLQYGGPDHFVPPLKRFETADADAENRD